MTVISTSNEEGIPVMVAEDRAAMGKRFQIQNRNLKTAAYGAENAADRC